MNLNNVKKCAHCMRFTNEKMTMEVKNDKKETKITYKPVCQRPDCEKRFKQLRATGRHKGYEHIQRQIGILNRKRSGDTYR